MEKGKNVEIKRHLRAANAVEKTRKMRWGTELDKIPTREVILMYAKYGKRWLDIHAALLLLILLSPIFVILTLLGLFAMGGRPFFVHWRPGRGERLFRLLKFRTMREIPD